jgi:hypothetical protein
MVEGHMRPKHITPHPERHAVWFAGTKGPTGAHTLGKVEDTFKGTLFATCVIELEGI